MSLWDKLSDARDLVKDEYQRHFGENDPYAKVGEAGASPAPEVGFVPSVETADQAYARLGLSGGNTLDEVRAAYRSLAMTWHPRAHREGTETSLARRHLDGFLEALELLEEHLLPLP